MVTYGTHYYQHFIKAMMITRLWRGLMRIVYIQLTKLNFTTEAVRPELCLRVVFHDGLT
ncbi:hypothetical protein [Moraxella lacunata]|uniref:hypothetical protein n=1 Tax=Moraxella lacunata TaxID=477 RepID=UPI000AE56508